jgi:hypothetical protein
MKMHKNNEDETMEPLHDLQNDEDVDENNHDPMEQQYGQRTNAYNLRP